jgi:chromosomal replication initiation ATPase DnaA
MDPSVLDYRNQLAQKLIKKFVDDFKYKTGLKISINFDSDEILNALNLNEKKEKLPVVSLYRLQEIVLSNLPYKVSDFEFTRKCRRREFVDSRIIFCHLARRLNFNFSTIGRYLGKHHTSIMHLDRRGDELLEYDAAFGSIYYKIQEKVRDAYAEVI